MSTNLDDAIKGIAQARKDKANKESQAIKNRGAGVVGDVAIGVGKGALQVPDILAGLADIVPGLFGADRPVSKLTDAIGEATGFQPKKWAEESNYSPKLQRQIDENQARWDDDDTSASELFQGYLKNPALISNFAAESAVPTLAGGVLGKVAKSFAVGEGAVIAGSAMSGIDKDVDPQVAAGSSLLQGVLGGLIGKAGGKISDKLGTLNPDNLFSYMTANGVSQKAAKKVLENTPINKIKQLIYGTGIEGGEEAAQSLFETGLSNLAEGKPFAENLTQNVVEGSIAGAGMGGAINLAPRKGIFGRAVDKKSETESAQQKLLGVDDKKTPLETPDENKPQNKLDRIIFFDNGDQTTHRELFNTIYQETNDPAFAQSYIDNLISNQDDSTNPLPSYEDTIAAIKNKDFTPSEDAINRKGFVDNLGFKDIKNTQRDDEVNKAFEDRETTKNEEAAHEQRDQQQERELNDAIDDFDVSKKGRKLLRKLAAKNEIRRRNHDEFVNNLGFKITEYKDSHQSSGELTETTLEHLFKEALNEQVQPTVEQERSDDRTQPVGNDLPINGDGSNLSQSQQEEIQPTDGGNNSLSRETELNEQKNQTQEESESAQEITRTELGDNNEEKIDEDPSQNNPDTSTGINRNETSTDTNNGNDNQDTGLQGQREQETQTDSSEANAPSTEVQGVKIDQAKSVQSDAETDTNSDAFSQNEQTIPSKDEEVNTNPSEAQKEAGNYKKEHKKISGLDISIENPKGSTRSGKDTNGKSWSTKMKSAYGYIKGTVGHDKDHVDIFLGDSAEEATSVFVVDQIDPSTGKFDEHKVMMGFSDEAKARKGYAENYDKGWKGLDNITEMTIPEFKEWVYNKKKTNRPANELKTKNQQVQVPKDNKPPSSQKGTREDYHPAIESLAQDLTEGGGVAYTKDKDGKIDGRTPSLNPSWFINGALAVKTVKGDKDLSKPPSVKTVKKAVQDYLEGGDLKPAQIRILEALDEIAVAEEEFQKANLNEEDLKFARELNALIISSRESGIEEYVQKNIDSGDIATREDVLEWQGEVDYAKQEAASRADKSIEEGTPAYEEEKDQVESTQGDMFIQTKGEAENERKQKLQDAKNTRVERSKNNDGSRTSKVSDKKRATLVANVKRSEIKTGITRVTSPQDALHVIAPIRKRAQETMIAVVLDSNGDVIQIINHTEGIIDAASVDSGILVGAILDVDNADSVYFAHNHPSGAREQSDPDLRITKKLDNLLEGTGVVSKGMLVIANGGKGSYFNPRSGHDVSYDITATQAPRNKRVDVTERIFKRKGALHNGGITSAEQAISLTSDVASNHDGILLLDNQNNALSFIPMPVAQMNELRTDSIDSGASLLLREMHLVNARAIIGVINEKDNEHKDIRTASNIASFIKAATNSRLLDFIVGSESLASSNKLPEASDVYYSKSKKSTGSTKAQIESLLPKRVRKLVQQGKLKVVQSVSNLPKRLQSRGTALYHATFHGSPYDHNKFKSDNIGTGEGLGIYGHGHYFADNKSVAKWYRDNLAIKKIAINGKPLKYQSDHLANKLRLVLQNVKRGNLSFDEAIEDAASDLEASKMPIQIEGAKTIRGFSQEQITEIAGGKLYEVELAPKQDEYLLWDKTLSEQSKKIQSSLKSLGYKPNIDNTYGDQFYRDIVTAFSQGDKWTNKAAKKLGYDPFSEDYGSQSSEKLASEYLHSLGIRGVKYLDGSSRSKGEGDGDYNYVIFSDNDIEITAKYSQDLEGVEGLYDESEDMLYFVADMLDENNIDQVTNHELFHRARATDKKLQGQLSELDKRLKVRFDLAAKGIGSEAELDAYARVMDADTKLEHQIEEFQAYLISIYNTKPESLSSTVRKWIADLFAAIKAALFRQGINVGDITSADLNALAKYGSKVDNKVNKVASAVALASKQGYKGDDKQEAREWTQAVNAGLDMSKEARMKRAKAMGFDVDTIWYHGGAKGLTEIYEETPDRGSLGAFYLTSDKGIAANYALANGIYVEGFSASKDIKKIGSARLEAGRMSEEEKILKGIDFDPNERRKIYKLLTNSKNSIDPSTVSFSEILNVMDRDVINDAIDDHLYTEIRDHFDSDNNQDTKDYSNKDIEDFVNDYYNEVDAEIKGEIFGYDGTMLSESSPAFIFLGETGMTNKFLEGMKKDGYDSIEVRGDLDSFGTSNTLIVFKPSQVRSVNAAFNPDYKDSGNLLASEDTYERIYSQLKRAIQRTPDRIFKTGKQTSQWLTSNAPKLGIKADELYWSGIYDWLDMQDKLTKAAVVNYLDENGVKVDTVVLGGRGDVFLYAYKTEERLKEQIGDDRELVNKDGTLKKGLEIVKEVDGWHLYDSSTTNAKHNNNTLTLPGGKDYQELVVTIPATESFNKNDDTHFGDVGAPSQTDINNYNNEKININQYVDNNFSGIVERMKAAGALEVKCG